MCHFSSVFPIPRPVRNDDYFRYAKRSSWSDIPKNLGVPKRAPDLVFRKTLECRIEVLKSPSHKFSFRYTDEFRCAENNLTSILWIYTYDRIFTTHNWLLHIIILHRMFMIILLWLLPWLCDWFHDPFFMVPFFLYLFLKLIIVSQIISLDQNNWARYLLSSK